MLNIHQAKQRRSKKDRDCKKCGEKILKGDQYISVCYFDGYVQHGYGAFHVDCWK